MKIIFIVAAVLLVIQLASALRNDEKHTKEAPYWLSGYPKYCREDQCPSSLQETIEVYEEPDKTVCCDETKNSAIRVRTNPPRASLYAGFELQICECIV